MALSAITFHIQDGIANAITGAILSATSVHGPWQGITDSAGNFTAYLTPGHYDIMVTAFGYMPRLLPADLENAGTITIGLTALTSTGPRIEGKYFVDAYGQRMVYKGCDQFCAYRQFLDNATSQLALLTDESQALGFDMWRVFLMGSKAQNGILQLSPSEPGYYSHLRPFAHRLNGIGITLLATVFVDAQDIIPNVTDQQSCWAKVADELRGTDTILSCGNEWPKNGFNPSNFSDPHMVWSRGSALGDEAPYRPYGSIAEFHPRRDLPAALMDTVASPVYIYGTNGLTGPLIIDEPPRMGTDGSGPDYLDPHLCWKFARHYATECGAAVFHSRAGQRGVLMDGPTKACAEAWQSGMKL